MEKERRNLLILSFLIIVQNYAQIEIKEINILGNTAKVNNPIFLKIIVVLLWFYFLYRFYQYVVSNNFFGLHKIWKQKVNRNAKPIMQKRLKQKGFQNINTENLEFDKKINKNFWYWKFTHNLGGRQSKDGGYKPNSEFYEIQKIKFGPSYIRAFLQISTHELKFSEYILPFLIAAASAGSIIYRLI